MQGQRRSSAEEVSGADGREGEGVRVLTERCERVGRGALRKARERKLPLAYVRLLRRLEGRQ